MKTIMLESTIRWMLALGLTSEVQDILNVSEMKTTRDGLKYLVIKN